MKTAWSVCLFLVLGLSSASLWAQVYTVETVPNTKLSTNSYVSDPSGLLNDTTVARLNQWLGELESASTAQVAVVMLPSIGDDDRFEFAQQLFRHWGIGQADKDNGLLILFILDQRNIRFHTGYGLEGVLPDARCKQLQMQFMVPHFKAGDYNTGMWWGVQKTVALLSAPDAVNEILSTGEAESDSSMWPLGILYFIVMVIAFVLAATGSKFQPHNQYPRTVISKKRWLILYAVLPFVLITLIGAFSIPFTWGLMLFYLMIIAWFMERYYRIIYIISPVYAKRNKHQELHNYYHSQNGFWLRSAIFFPVPMIFVYLAFKKQRDAFRTNPRPCKKCSATLIKLSEQTEDEYLSAGQMTEEKIGTNDYDVWKCNACGFTEVLRYPGKSAHFTSCPKCHFLTYHFAAKRTVVSPTYSTEGKGEQERTCMHCGLKNVEVFVIPMLVAAESSDSSSSGSSSSSSGSGGSWGGGDSGGGGSDSSW
jgi:uncharacterized protein